MCIYYPHFDVVIGSLTTKLFILYINPGSTISSKFSFLIRFCSFPQILKNAKTFLALCQKMGKFLKRKVAECKYIEMNVNIKSQLWY